MTMQLSDQPEKEVIIYIGGVHASDEPVTIRTLLGSCISVCLYDPITKVGGMNHFMLPRGGESGEDGADATRFGVHAMDCLIGSMMKLGADRRRLVAKYFGGGHVLDIADSVTSVPRRNIEFIREFLETERFPVLSQDTGGTDARSVHFRTATGRAFVKRVVGARSRGKILSKEREQKARPANYGDVTLFD